MRLAHLVAFTGKGRVVLVHREQQRQQATGMQRLVCWIWMMRMKWRQKSTSMRGRLTEQIHVEEVGQCKVQFTAVHLARWSSQIAAQVVCSHTACIRPQGLYLAAHPCMLLNRWSQLHCNQAAHPTLRTLHRSSSMLNTSSNRCQIPMQPSWMLTNPDLRLLESR